MDDHDVDDADRNDDGHDNDHCYDDNFWLDVDDEYIMVLMSAFLGVHLLLYQFGLHHIYGS